MVGFCPGAEKLTPIMGIPWKRTNLAAEFSCSPQVGRDPQAAWWHCHHVEQPCPTRASAPLLPGAWYRAWGGRERCGGLDSPGWVSQAVGTDGWWGAEGHMQCFDSFFQEDYIPYPSIDEVGAPNHPEHLAENAFPKLPVTGEFWGGGVLFQRGAAQSMFPPPHHFTCCFSLVARALF